MFTESYASMLSTIRNPIDRHASDVDSSGYDTQDTCIPKESDGGPSTYPSEAESLLSAFLKGAKLSTTLPANAEQR